MKLSILIPSIYDPDRIETLTRLKTILYPQKTDNVEVLIMFDHREQSTGEKRNNLLRASCGEYITFVDDDDLVSDNYVSSILKAIESGPDVVGIHLQHFINGTLNGNTAHSIQYDSWKNIPNDNGIWTYQRCPNHLNPVKRELALKAMFPDLTIGEDKEYSMRLRKHLNSEVMIDEPIYFYMQRA